MIMPIHQFCTFSVQCESVCEQLSGRWLVTQHFTCSTNNSKAIPPTFRPLETEKKESCSWKVSGMRLSWRRLITFLSRNINLEKTRLKHVDHVPRAFFHTRQDIALGMSLQHILLAGKQPKNFISKVFLLLLSSDATAAAANHSHSRNSCITDEVRNALRCPVGFFLFI